MRSHHILGMLVLAVLAIWSADYYYEFGIAAAPRSEPLIAAVEAQLGLPVNTVSANGLEESPALKKLLQTYDGKPLALDARTQSSACAVRGPLPDPGCTPGAVFTDASTTTICTPGYSRSVRSVSVKMKRQVYAEYGLSYPQASGVFEADHLIPLELGGSNDIANLFPEAAEPQPGFHEKDLVENYLHNEVCDGAITLSAAQEQIARDWLAVYDTITPATIAALKRQIASYGD